TVYEAEVIGLTLAVKLLASKRDPSFPVSIYVNNQAVIQSGENPSAKPGHYILDHFRRLVRTMKKKYGSPMFNLTVRWISGHNSVQGNESANKEAKLAAGNPSNNSPVRKLPLFLHKGVLPSSISALKQAQKNQSKARW
ncbi:hypothetical protein PAXINDRAFT_53669, partial [Paxillus involutus ATCC 200175]